jgi:hypothetical protein
MSKETDWLDANPVAEDNFTTDKAEAQRLGIYWRPLCECGCGEASRYTLGVRRKGHRTHDIASWECRKRLRESGITKNTKMISTLGIRFVKVDANTGSILG